MRGRGMGGTVHLELYRRWRAEETGLIARTGLSDISTQERTKAKRPPADRFSCFTQKMIERCRIHESSVLHGGLSLVRTNRPIVRIVTISPSHRFPSSGEGDGRRE